MILQDTEPSEQGPGGSPQAINLIRSVEKRRPL